MKYTDIISDVVTIIDRSDATEPRARSAVRRCLLQVQRAHKWNCARATSPDKTAPLAFVGNRADLPQDFRGMLAVRLQGTWDGQVQTVELYPTSIEAIVDLRRRGLEETAAVSPTEYRYALDGGQLVLNFTPPSDAAATLDYQATLDLPVTDSDWWSVNAYDVLVNGAIMLLLIELGEEERALSAFGALYREGLQAAILVDRESGAVADTYTPPPRGSNKRRY